MTTRKVARKAGDGQFTSKAEAEANPDETVVETIEFPEAEQAEEFVPPQPNFHPILKVWKEVLSNAEAESKKNPSPTWCQGIVGNYIGLSFADCLDVRDLYFELLNDQYLVLLAEIETDPDCLSYSTPEEDLENNTVHYLNLITAWTSVFLRYELAWDCQDPQAAARIAALSEVHKMYLGNTGLTQHLDNIRFQFTETDGANMREVLDAILAEREGDGE